MSTKQNLMVFPTKYSESVQIGTFETFTKPSMTEPDNAMSIPEIIARFTRGYGIGVEQHAWTQGSASEGGEVLNDLQDFFEQPRQQETQQKETQQQETQQKETQQKETQQKETQQQETEA